MSDMTGEQTDRTSMETAPEVRSPGASAFRAAFRNRAFVACLVLMAVLLGAYQTTIMAKGTVIKKLPVPLRVPLSQLDATRLAPYNLLQASDIKPEVLDALGTHLYIDWLMEDTSVTDRSAPERYIRLFISYYTDVPGQVPHVSEECMVAAGHKEVSEEIVEVPVPDLQQTVPVKLQCFERLAFLGRESRTVMYTFHTNGRFAPDRQMVRAILNRPRDKHSYFSKVEISFGTNDASPSTEKAAQAGRRFLAKLLPILVKEHWPDWQAIERESPVEPAKSTTENPVK